MKKEMREMTLTPASFLPGGKITNALGEISDVLDGMEINYQDKDREVIAVVSIKGLIEFCPLCCGIIPDDAFALITDVHSLYPCMECNQLVEKRNI